MAPISSTTEEPSIPSSKGPCSSVSTCSTLQGDSKLRITVPMPKTVQDLHSHTFRIHGHTSKKPDVYHHGKKNIRHDKHVDKLEHGHVLVVAKPLRDALDYDTTNTTSYVTHPIEARPVAEPPRVRENVPFEGTTTHTTDFVAHAIPARVEFEPPPRPRSQPFKGESTYKSNYTKHELPPKQIPEKVRPAPKQRFEGQPTYKSDYTQHELPKRIEQAPHQPPNKVPFKGSTTYGGDFKKHPIGPRPAPQPLAERPKTAFTGVTEYSQTYLKHKFPEKLWIHIEPEMRLKDGTFKSHKKNKFVPR